MSVDPIEKELRAAQAAFLKAPARRRQAVQAAMAVGPPTWTRYRIAKTLGVDESTVRAILKAAGAADKNKRGQGR